MLCNCECQVRFGFVAIQNFMCVSYAAISYDTSKDLGHEGTMASYGTGVQVQDRYSRLIQILKKMKSLVRSKRDSII